MTQRALPAPRAERALMPSRIPSSVAWPSTCAVEEVSVLDIWRIVRRRQATILVCTFVCTLLALAASLCMTTKYESVATVEVNKETSDMLGLSPVDKIDGSGSDSLEQTVTLETEANALQNASLAFEVAEQLNLERRP